MSNSCPCAIRVWAAFIATLNPVVPGAASTALNNHRRSVAVVLSNQSRRVGDQSPQRRMGSVTGLDHQHQDQGRGDEDRLGVLPEGARAGADQ